jgi:hypothetical protein
MKSCRPKVLTFVEGRYAVVCITVSLQRKTYPVGVLRFCASHVSTGTQVISYFQVGPAA